MQWHAVKYDEEETAPLMSNAVFRFPQSGGSFQTGGPVISRVSRVKTATVTITTTKGQTTILNTASSLSLPSMDAPTATASSMLSATSSIAPTLTAPSTKEITPQPTSTGSTPAAPQVSVPVNTLVAIIAGTIGGILLLVFFIAVAQAFMRRRRIIHEETQTPGGASSTLEKGGPPGGQRQHRVNDGNIGTPHPSPSAHSDLGITQQYQAAYIVPNAGLRTWPVAHDLHSRQDIAELPAESHTVHSQYDHRG